MLDLINTVTPDVMLCPETQHNVWQSAVTVLHNFYALIFPLLSWVVPSNLVLECSDLSDLILICKTLSMALLLMA